MYPTYPHRGLLICLFVCSASLLADKAILSQESEPDQPMALARAKEIGLERSSYLNREQSRSETKSPSARLVEFREHIAPVLKAKCFACHGEETQESDFRVDTLNPNLLEGADVNWWLEVLAVVSNGEMPPAGEPQLMPEETQRVVDWLSTEMQVASAVRRDM